MAPEALGWQDNALLVVALVRAIEDAAIVCRPWALEALLDEVPRHGPSHAPTVVDLHRRRRRFRRTAALRKNVDTETKEQKCGDGSANSGFVALRRRRDRRSWS